MEKSIVHNLLEGAWLIGEIRSDLKISDDFGAFWRYLEQAPEMTIELDHRSILEEEYRSMFTLEHRSTAKRAESPFDKRVPRNVLHLIEEGVIDQRGGEGMEKSIVHNLLEGAWLIGEIRSDLKISDDFGAFWRYLEQAPEMTIELDHRSILEEEYRSMFTLEHRSTAKRAESPFGHNRLEAQVFTNLQD
ncbi:hypothetical protein DY000_02030903 [Brassica cretica]|uniref:Uncharacterized protein n=1 Tax=Brassica cretica TaxID=69181 RepID=A0ABQ7DHM0_BRACR|nr:hypothetical protein DY000_02030903 [Brassica cretica]